MNTPIERALLAALTALAMCASACQQPSPSPPVQDTSPERAETTPSEAAPPKPRSARVVLASQEELRELWEAATPVAGEADQAGRRIDPEPGTVLAESVGLSKITELGTNPISVPCHIAPKLCTPDPEFISVREPHETQNLRCKVYKIHQEEEQATTADDSQSTYVGLCGDEDEE